MGQTYKVVVEGHEFWEDDLTGFDAERIMAYVGVQTYVAFYRHNPKSLIAQWACFWLKLHPDSSWEQALDKARAKSAAWLQRQFVDAEEDDRPGNYLDGLPDPPKGVPGTD